MHRLLVSRVLCNARCSASRGGTGTSSSQVWESSLKLLWLTTRNSVQFNSSKADFPPASKPPQPLQDLDKRPEELVSEVVVGVGNCEETNMESVAGSSGEGKSKRTREFLSPIRARSSKKKTKGVKGGGKASSSDPPLIYLDDIPIPSKASRSAKKKVMPSLNFIPLPPSPPPPLPPPLPTPPPPPAHSEMDEVMADFFVIDTAASGTLFPLPLPPHLMTDNDKAHKHGSKTTEVLEIVNSPDEISVVYNSGLQDQFQNINLLDKSKSSTKSVKRKSSDTEQIDVVFEGKWPWVIKSPGLPQMGRRQHDLLTNKPSVSEQVRNCHQSTKVGFKTIEKSPEPEIVSSLDTSETEVITLETSRSSLLGRVSPENFLSLNTNKTTLYGDGEKEVITLEPLTKTDKRSKKSQKRKSKETRKQLEGNAIDANTGSTSDALNRETSPDIQKVGVIDPDVVEIDDSFACVDMEIVDVYDSDLEERLSASNTDNLDGIDVHDSDKESVDASPSHSGGIDITTEQYLSLGKTTIEELENNEIDIDDRVLQWRGKLESLRSWVTTRLGEEVLVHNRVRKNDTIFTLMSYNVLAQQLLLDNQYLYNACDKSHLEWRYRWYLLQHEIEDLSPDVLLLQEVQSTHYYSHFLPWLTLKGYNGIYKKRTGEKCDGCAIFFKTNKFSMLEHCTVEYLQPKASKVLDRDNIGIIAKLAPIDNPQSVVCVATTHFLYNPKRHDVKLAQAVLLLTELDRICYEGEENGQPIYCPIILTGDFNSEPHSALLDMMKEGRVHYEGLSARTLTQHGSYPILGAQLIPSTLGITDRCQHAVLAQSRFVEKRTGRLFSLSDKRKIEESLIRLKNSDRSHSLKGVQGGCTGPPPTGWYSHNFNFSSVYRHYTRQAVEATTFHNKWTSVDYILFSRIYSHNHGQSVEGKLKLLGRYRLLTGTEASRFAPLPSSVCPSDHFPLAAQFLIREK